MGVRIVLSDVVPKKNWNWYELEVGIFVLLANLYLKEKKMRLLNLY